MISETVISEFNFGNSGNFGDCGNSRGVATCSCRAESHQKIEVKMNFRILWALVLTVLFSLGAFAQSDTGGLKQDTKDAAHDTAKATKKAGRKIKRGTKKVVHNSAR